jgi:hypothetical protein
VSLLSRTGRLASTARSSCAGSPAGAACLRRFVPARAPGSGAAGRAAPRGKR